MGVKKKKGKERLDKFYHLAKEQNLRARSAFKLIQLDQKFPFLSRCRGVVDLCAAPGGWMQVARNICPSETYIIGVDLVPIKPVRGCQSLVGDITSKATMDKVKKMVNAAPNGCRVDAVLHDGAPNVGSSWHMDAYNQSELVLHALKFATETLEPGGVFATKVFRSQDYNSLMWVMKQLFDSVQATKPVASRNVSAEIFVVCQGYRAPKRIDPRFLDPKHVFKEIGSAPGDAQTLAAKGSVEAFRDPAKKRRRAEGYEDGITLLRRVCTARDFIDCEDPVLHLTSHNEFTFEGDGSAMLLERRETDAEVKALCADLKVLNKKDFKALLKWREKMKDADAEEERKRKREAGEEDEDDDYSDAMGSDEEDSLASTESEGEKLDKELAKVERERQLVEKRKRRALRKKRAKIQRRIDLKMILPGDEIEMPIEEDAFKLSMIKNEKELDTVLNAGSEMYDRVISGEIASSDDEDNKGGKQKRDSDEEDEFAGVTDVFERERLARLRDLDEQANEMYSRYTTMTQDKKKKSRVLSSKRARVDQELDDLANPDVKRRQVKFIPDTQSLFNANDDKAAARKAELSDDDDERSSDSDEVAYMSKRKSGRGNGDDEDSGAEYERIMQETSLPRSNPLIADPTRLAGPSENASRKAKIWYSNPLFAGIDDDDDDDDESSSITDVRNNDAKKKNKSKSNKDSKKSDNSKAKGKHNGMDIDSDAGNDKGNDDDDEDDDAALLSDDDGFEVVPQEDVLSDSDESFDDVGDAEILALGKAMIDKKVKSDLIDDSYNRYAFADQDLPKWFNDDESKHNRPELPVTKEAVEEMKARFRLVNSRPIKKIAEAKARKRSRIAKKVEKIKSQVSAVIENAEMSEKEKAKAVEKLYKGMAHKSKPGKTQIIVNRGNGNQSQGKGSKGKGRGKVKVVDKRLKADLRGATAKEKRSKKGGKRRGRR